MRTVSILHCVLQAFRCAKLETEKTIPENSFIRNLDADFKYTDNGHSDGYVQTLLNINVNETSTLTTITDIEATAEIKLLLK